MAEADRANRPSLVHWLLLITCCAIYFALARQFLDPADRQADGDAALPFMLYLSLLSIVTGICWTGMVVVFYRKIRGLRVTTEPGDWLMFCIGVVEAVNMLAQLLPDNFVLHRNSLPLAIRGIVFVMPMLSRRVPGIWKLMFAILVIVSQIPLAAALLVAFDALPQNNSIVGISGTVQPYLILSALAMTVFVDYRNDHRRSWSHWLGVASLLIWMFI